VSLVVIGVGLGAPAVARADDIRDREWHLRYLGVAEAQRNARGEGVTVAVLDTGVDYRHPDLKGAVLEGRTFSGGREDARDDVGGHGTAMASLIAGRGHGARHRDGVMGVAPGARVLPVRTYGGGLVRSKALQQAIRWAADHDADVINVSQGYVDDSATRDAVDYAQAKGAVVIAAVGNTTQGDQKVAAPAMYPGVVAVSATNEHGNFAEESISGPEVVLSAPGTDIMAAGSGKRGMYATGTGTSNSTAIVSGVAALIKSRYPDMDAANIINRLIATADDKGPNGRDPQYGFGIVNPVKALTADEPFVKSNPLVKPSPSDAASAATAADDGSSSDFPLLGLAGLAALLFVVLAGLGFVLVRRGHASQ